MATNKYIRNYPTEVSDEQILIEDLMIETIRFWGEDVWYLPRRSLSTQDMVYGEDPGSIFNEAYSMEMYISSTMGPEGPSEFFKKFGLEIKDQIRLQLARKTFQKYISTMDRPREGDLVYVPVLNGLFEIKFVEEEKDFHSLGRKAPHFYMYELLLEQFRYSNERFQTGINEIDAIAEDYAYSINVAFSSGGTGTYTLKESVYQGADWANATATAIVKSWNSTANTLGIIHIKGEFTAGNTVTGNTSGASYTISTYDPLDFSTIDDEIADNLDLETEADAVINFDESDPFGSP